MILLVDVGNSRMKWAFLRDGALLDRGSLGRAQVDAGGPLDAWPDNAEVDRVLICSVAGAGLDARLEALVRGRLGLSPEWFRARRKTLGIVNAYAEPSHLGSDRWAALLGARGLAGGAVGVVDCGTALTLDVVDAGDRHLGGFIIPGPDLARDSLLSRTGSVREAAGDVDGVLGRSTAACVTNGTLLGLAGAVERWIAEVEAGQERVDWFATGGAWPRLAGLVRRELRHEPDLVLEGLARTAGAEP